MRPSRACWPPASWLCGLALGSWLSFLGGCASPHWKQALQRPLNFGKQSLQVAKDAGKSRKAKSKTSPATTDSALAESDTPETLPPSRTDTPESTHAPEVAALIEREIAGFPADEQARARTALATVPAADVPAVLNVWKVTLAQADKQVTNAAWDQQAALKSVPDASNTSTSPPFNLGQNNPWQKMTPPATMAAAPGAIQQTAYSPTTTRSGHVMPPDWSTVAGNPPTGNNAGGNYAGAEYRFPATGGHAPTQAELSGSTNWGAGANPRQPPQWPHAGNPPQPYQSSATAPQPWPGTAGYPAAPAGMTAADFQAHAQQQRSVMQPPAWNHQGGQQPGLTQTRGTLPRTQPRMGFPGMNPAAAQVSNFAADATIPTLDPYAFPDQTPVTTPRNGPVPTQTPVPVIPSVPAAQQVAAVGGLQIRPTQRFNPQDVTLAPGQRLPGFEHGNGSASLPAVSQNLPIALPARSQFENPVLLQQLLSQAESQVTQMSPGSESTELTGYIREHVHLRLLYLIAGQTERALQPIPGVAAEDQEFWTQVLWGMHNYFDAEKIQNPSDRAAQTVQQFNTAVQRLQSRAPLELKNMALCQRINSFGDYETFERDTFTPGQQVLLYAEIKNFHSEPTPDGRYRTLLKSTVQIFKPGPNGELVDERVFPSTEDLCKNQRRDYFHSYLLELPVRINAGPHVLKLVVEDELNHKVSTATLNFQVQ